MVELQIALEPAEVDLAPVDGVLDGAFGFVGVRAVGELAEGDIGAELDEVALELGGLDAPELELAEARRIDDVAARFEPDQLGGGGRVLALEGPVGDRADAEVQARLDRVQERALADAALAREGGGVPAATRARSRSIPRPSAAEVRIVS